LIFSTFNYSLSNINETCFVSYEWHLLLTPGLSFGLRHTTTDAKPTVWSDGIFFSVFSVHATKLLEIMFEPTLGKWTIWERNSWTNPWNKNTKCVNLESTHEKTPQTMILNWVLVLWNQNAKQYYQTVKQSSQKKAPPEMWWARRAISFPSWRICWSCSFLFHCPFYILELRWGWVFLERKRILSGIQFTAHFINFFVVETKQVVSSFVNMILTRQTCGQRSNRAQCGKQTPSARNLFFRANLLYVPNIKM